MALPVGSGQVSLGDIHTEVGGIALTQVGLGDADVRDWVNDPSGEISMSQFIIPTLENSRFQWDTISDFTVTSWGAGSYPTTFPQSRVRLQNNGRTSTSLTNGNYSLDVPRYWASNTDLTEVNFIVTATKISGSDWDVVPSNVNLGTNREFGFSATGTILFGGATHRTGTYDLTIEYQPHKSIVGTVRVTCRQILDPS